MIKDYKPENRTLKRNPSNDWVIALALLILVIIAMVKLFSLADQRINHALEDQQHLQEFCEPRKRSGQVEFMECIRKEVITE